jgi:hypothetical protein
MSFCLPKLMENVDQETLKEVQGGKTINKILLVWWQLIVDDNCVYICCLYR